MTQKCKQQQVSEGCKKRISLFGGFQKGEFCHEAEKFHPCNKDDDEGHHNNSSGGSDAADSNDDEEDEIRKRI